MKFRNRYTKTALAAAVCLSMAFSFPSAATETPDITPEMRYNMEIQSNSWENWPSGPQVYAEAAIVMEASTGTILYSKNIDQRLEPASITKVMTVLLALENLDMDEEVTFSHNAVYSIEYDSSHIARDEGEVLTVEECLYAILLESANECSNAIAEHTSGSVEAFADLMNQRAAELGCTNTHFVNPHGLPNPDHYTTARDMALITQEAIRHTRFRKIGGTPRYTLRATNKKDEELLMNNHHLMISSNRTSKFLDDTVFCGKNGYTTVALNTLVTCATRNDMDLIVVTLKTKSSGQRGVPLYSDTENLLNYAGEHFHKVSITENETGFTLKEGETFSAEDSPFDTAPVLESVSGDCVILPTDAAFSDTSCELNYQETDDSKVTAVLNYTYSGQPVGAANLLLTDVSPEAAGLQKTEADNTAASTETEKPMTSESPFANPFLWAAGIAAVLALLLLAAVLTAGKQEGDQGLSFRPYRRWQNWHDQRNSFGNRQRKKYKSKKRRKSNRRF